MLYTDRVPGAFSPIMDVKMAIRTVHDEDIVFAIQKLERLRGGQIAVANGKVLAELPLPIAGLVTNQPLPKAIDLIDDLNAAARRLGCNLAAPFMTMSFLSLSHTDSRA